MLAYEDIPARLNLTSCFLDRNLAEGRAERTALVVGDDRAYTTPFSFGVGAAGIVFPERKETVRCGTS